MGRLRPTDHRAESDQLVGRAEDRRSLGAKLATTLISV
jgi:hypothetical protein